ncbi:unnamed protein product [Symbiodinium sp. KB8]|nr:unnamed protein product [Symbiodinium sp. KB8]
MLAALAELKPTRLYITSDDGAIYGKAFDVTKAALSKWQLPEVIQVHLDWFPGKFKRDVRAGEVKLTTHQAVVEGIGRAAAGWCKPLSLADEQTNSPITLMGRSVSCEMPLHPDLWMIQDGRKIRRYLCLAIGQPRAIPQGLLSLMVAILKARNISRMQTLLRAEGIVEEADGSEKFNKTKHAELWNTYCLAWLQEPEVETGDLITNCTCWLNCSRGHCIHRYVIREWFGHPIPQPPALTIEAFRGKSAAEALAVSEEEDCPRRHASRASFHLTDVGEAPSTDGNIQPDADKAAREASAALVAKFLSSARLHKELVQTADVVTSDAFFHSLAMIVRFFNVLPDLIQMSRDQLWPFVSESLECGTQTMTQWSATVYVSEHAEGLALDPFVNLEHVQYRVGEEGPLSNDPLFHWVAEAFRCCNIQPLSQWTSLKQALHKIFEDASADLDRVAYLILSATKYSVLLRSPAGWLHFDSHTYSPLCLDASAACVVTSVQELLDHMCNDRDDFKPYNGDDDAERAERASFQSPLVHSLLLDAAEQEGENGFTASSSGIVNIVSQATSEFNRNHKPDEDELLQHCYFLAADNAEDDEQAARLVSVVAYRLHMKNSDSWTVLETVLWWIWNAAALLAALSTEACTQIMETIAKKLAPHLKVDEQVAAVWGVSSSKEVG